MKKHFNLFVIHVLSWISIHAQDPQFAQYFNNPIYLNPALTGFTEEHRVICNYRNQWLGLSKAFQTMSLSYDNSFSDKKNAVGVQLWRDMAGSSRFNTTSLAASYAYDFKFKNEIEIRSGIQAGYVAKSVNTSSLVFNDQLMKNGPAISNDASLMYNKFGFLDINAGFIVRTLIYWGGINVSHVNRPKMSELSKFSKLPVKFSIHGGYKFVQVRKANTLLKYIEPTFNYRSQGSFDQLDIGVYYVNVPLNFGFWYRGLPTKKYLPTYPNNDALCFLVGMDVKDHCMRVSYSYDLSLNRLFVNSTGSHEVSLIYEFSPRAVKARKTVISGPTF